MRMLVTGATGYVGGAIVDACVRAGHQVTVVVRNVNRLKPAVRDHVAVHVSQAADADGWDSLLADHEVLIHAAADTTAKAAALDKQIVDAFGRAARLREGLGRATVVVYTSGIWVLGAAPDAVDETAPTQPATLVAWRPAHEQAILELTSAAIRTAVIRPGIVFGGSRGIVGDMLRDGANGLIRIVGSGQNRWPLVHLRDLADLYLRVATSPGASGIFHATDDSTYRVIDIAEAIGAHMTHCPDVRHIPLDEARAKLGAYADAITLDQVVRSTRARALGWEPGFKSLVANVSTVFEEWRADHQ